MNVQEVLVDFFMKDVSEVFILNASWKFDLYHVTLVIETDHKESRACHDCRWLGIQLCKILLSPLNGRC